MEAHRFAGVELGRFGGEADRGADPQRQRAPGRGPQPAAAVEGDLDAARGPGREPQLEAPAVLGDDATTFRRAPTPAAPRTTTVTGRPSTPRRRASVSRPRTSTAVP